ncbi:microsomal dipeptidase-like Zn-dependent dipeptidase [Pontibacter ummariensis]|uniref:Zn-dependent dipeptidase, dipeptidase homolog n=1 Tax=Pontibacter ummariensis TaxID=1610492 RepID=A0A239IK96_9BACT|nr:membrane dipeptidase [Pontibacter ummariensis]PRY09887.1 microsomal dipeptidase-like Zn-dependent dipeptidase [Pontibacter ummariensis]SNS93961.1 Zn-dependent dipeptidase, dipeptidase homolog [Pontibacter ummariensis]
MNDAQLPLFPVVDLHCDLLVYLTDVPGASPEKVEEIGCALPALTEGNVKLQVMAIYSAAAPGSTNFAALQRDMYKQLATDDNNLLPVTDVESLHQAMSSKERIGMVAAIENAAGFCEEDEPLEEGFKKLERIIADCERILYISLTHHTANRFGGGNMASHGITRDGKMLLDYLHGRRIAVDLSHTSDALAQDILTHIDQERLDIPVIASHSNFRTIWSHNRNLPDELVQEIVHRKGLIGMNFLRAFLHTDDPDALLHHILHGIGKGAADALCFGADYFYTADHPDPSRFPFYHKEHEQAGTSYNYLLSRLRPLLSVQQLEKLAYQNAANFIQRIWS